MAKPGFVHLHCHSAYSLAEGAIKIKQLVGLCQKDGMPAVALTDTNNLFGALEFAGAASDAGVQPIIGCQLAVAAPGLDTKSGYASVVLLAQNEAGYANLLRIASDAFMGAPEGMDPHVDLAELLVNASGLICLTGGANGPIDRMLALGQRDLAAETLRRLQDGFGDRLYVEIARHELPSEAKVEQPLLDLAYEGGTAIVAANDCYFSDASMYEAHDALLCIASGTYVMEDDRRRVTPHHRFKTAEEMAALFADLPEAVANTMVIARRCSFLLQSIKPILPRFAGEEGEAEALRRKAAEGLEARLERHVFATDMDAPARQAAARPYRERLDFELSVIGNMKFPGYFLIVADFIQWAKDHDIPVGPGRGSGAGSVVAWALTITDLDPLRFGLLFERFLNPDRVSMPDFDIDFCQDRRDEVIQYVRQRHGMDRVAQIITFGKLQARAVLRDVGRVLQMPYGQVDRICKLVPNNPAKPVTLGEAILGEPQLQSMRDGDEQVARLMDIALKLEGLYRHASTHAAGVVIADRPLEQLVPLYRDPKSDMPVTQFNMKYVEQAGLVKFDFLGLTTLTIIRKAEELIARSGITVDLDLIPLDDTKTYELLARAEGMGVFQLESSGMRDALRRLKPNRIEDIIALVALYRPGPMENIPKYGRVKDGQEPPDYLHPLLEPILKETFGIMVYQEQVMEIAQTLAGYSLGSADLLRRAMGKKIKSEMDAQREIFCDGAVAKGVDREQAALIFDLVAKFADYGFNKSHAAAYALVAYQTAWLKANYPVEFFAASMTLAMSNTDKLAAFRQELSRMGIRLLPPDINRSEAEFTVETLDGEKCIRYALAALKGVGRAAMDSLVAERARGGPYRELFDLAQRADGRALNKRQFESMANAGVFDSLNSNRAQVFASAEFVLKQATAAADERESGQVNLFGGPAVAPPPKLPIVATYDPLEKLAKEFSAVGFYLTAHPLDAHAKPLKRLGVVSSGDIARRATGAEMTRFKLAGVVVSKQERVSARGSRFAFVQLSDVSGIFEVAVFAELLIEVRPLLEPGKTLVVTADARVQGDDTRLTAQKIELLETAVASVASGLRVVCESGIDVSRMAALFKPGSVPGSGPVTGPARGRITLEIALPDHNDALIELPPGFALSPAARRDLERIEQVKEVEDL